MNDRFPDISEDIDLFDEGFTSISDESSGFGERVDDNFELFLPAVEGFPVVLRVAILAV